MNSEKGGIRLVLRAIFAIFFVVLPATIHAQDEFRVLGVASVEGGMRITWTSEPGQRYAVEVSTGLTGFGAVEGAEIVDAAAAPATETSIVDSTDRGAVAFYRVMRIGANVSDDLALIPAGSFQMGDAFGEGDSDELPVHSVYVSAFYIGKYEVTKALWDEVRTWGASHGYTDLAVGEGKAANHPVHTISWYSMVKWCNARSQKDGLTPCYTVGGVIYKTGNSEPVCNWTASGYRLPSEAEWEKAARGGLAGRRFPWGDTITHGRTNYYSYWLDGEPFYSYDITPTEWYHPTYNDGTFPYSAPVGSFAPNGYGLYDMAGNMWEWCWDWCDGSNYPASAVTDPHGPASGTCRVLRGGSWRDFAGHCRAAGRDGDSPGGSFNFFGFRVARSPVP